MMRITLFLSPLCLAGVFMLAACSEIDDAGRIAEAIAAMQQGIEQKQTDSVTEHLATDFRARHGKGSADIQALMYYYFRQHRKISVFTTNQEIRVDGKQADVTLDALLLAGENLLPEQGQRFEVAMRWQKSGAEWKLSRLKWQRAGP